MRSKTSLQEDAKARSKARTAHAAEVFRCVEAIRAGKDLGRFDRGVVEDARRTKARLDDEQEIKSRQSPLF